MLPHGLLCYTRGMSNSVTNPFHGMPRIVPPMGERRPLTGQSVEPLPLEPAVVPDPPVSREAIPRRTQGVTPALGVSPKPPQAAMPAPPAPAKPTEPSAFELAQAAMAHVGEENFQDEWSFEQKILWLLHRYPEEQVRQHWGSGIHGDYQAVLAKRQSYLKAAMDAGMVEPAQAVDDEEPTAAELEAIHAETPPKAPPVTQPETIYPVRVGDLWTHGSDRVASRVIEVLNDGTVRLSNGQSEVTTSAKFLQTPSTGWRFAGVSQSVQQPALGATPATSATPATPAASPQAEPPKRRLGKAQRERVEALAAEGKSAEEISQTLGLPLELVQRGMPEKAAQAASPQASPAVVSPPLTAAQAEAAYARPEEQEADLAQRRTLMEVQQAERAAIHDVSAAHATLAAKRPAASMRSRMSMVSYETLKNVESVLNWYGGYLRGSDAAELEEIEHPGRRLRWLAQHLRERLAVLEELDLGDDS